MPSAAAGRERGILTLFAALIVVPCYDSVASSSAVAVAPDNAVPFTANDRLAMIALPKTGTRSVELFLTAHLPLVIAKGGCLYALASPANRAAERWPNSTIFLQPDRVRDGRIETQVNPDLFLFHATVDEARQDWQRHQRAFQLPPSARLHMTTVVRDPVDRFLSEYFFQLELRLEKRWATGPAWRRQFWGAKDFTDDMLLQLQTVPPGACGHVRVCVWRGGGGGGRGREGGGTCHLEDWRIYEQRVDKSHGRYSRQEDSSRSQA